MVASATILITPGAQPAPASTRHKLPQPGHGPAQQQAWSGAPLPRHGCHLTGTMSSICGQQPPHISAHACHACKCGSSILTCQASKPVQTAQTLSATQAGGIRHVSRPPSTALHLELHVWYSVDCDMPALRACRQGLPGPRGAP
jgi:hypothetical protein